MRKLLAACMLLAMPAMAQAADPWTPTTEWTFQPGLTKCAMSRTFVSGSSNLSLGLVRDVFSGGRILIAVQPALSRQLIGKAAISAPGLPAVTSQIEPGGDAAGGAKMIAMPLDRATFGSLLSAKAMTIEGSKISLTIALEGTANVADTIAKCVDGHLHEWKVDPAEVDNDVHPDPNLPEPARKTWITPQDYPARARRSGEQGEVFMIWRVETDGSIKDCRVIRSSGSEELDTTSCAIIRTRGQYRPFLDREGHPAVTWKSARFNWVLPH